MHLILAGWKSTGKRAHHRGGNVDGATLQEKDNQQEERGAGDDVVVEGEDALGGGVAHRDVHGVGGAHLTHMLSKLT